MNNKKVVITGVNGFVGKNFLKVLKDLSPDSDVYGLDRRFGETGDFTPVKCDLTEKDKVKHILTEISPEYIFHFAGTAYDSEWDNLFNGNVKSTLTLLESAADLSPGPKIVIIGSAAEYGHPGSLPVDETAMQNPVSPYGASMCCRTNIALAFRNTGCDIVIGRVFNITGRGISEKSPVGAFAKQLAEIEMGKKEPVIHTGNLDPCRDFIDIADVASAFYYLATKSRKGGIYNICSGESHSIKDVLDTFLKLSMNKVKNVREPGLIRRNDITSIYGNNRKIGNETGWKPCVSFEDSLRETLDSYRKYMKHQSFNSITMQ